MSENQGTLLLNQSESILKEFASSESKFRLVSRSLEWLVDEISDTQNLFILDSSYNPPTLAHSALAMTALRGNKLKGSRRLLVLFSTANPDKAPKPASFAHRLVMITLFVQDLEAKLQQVLQEPIQVDIGLSSGARYIDKYVGMKEANVYKSDPVHIHLMGYDTVIRFLAPRYYTNYNPPLSALEPYFGDGNRIQVLLRPENSQHDTDEQKRYVSDLANGAFESDGFKKGWASLIDVLESDEANGISSTAVRTAANEKKWDKVSALVGDRISKWIHDFALYETDRITTS